VANSTTFWVNQLKAGNREAAQAIWRRYCRRLIELARKRLSGNASLGIADENDIAQSAFASFYRAAEQGRFPQLANSSDLWRLLIAITQRKISHQLRDQNRLKRKPISCDKADQREPINLDDIAGKEPTPQFGAIAIESFRELLDQLGNDTLRTVAVMKMEGYTNYEISERLTCSLSTVERKVRRIRHEWSSVDQERGQ
jgi:RNA polymerase sigma factor (sigma-70 family)